jgi:predicted MFS family arabinose efflux permease
MFGASLLFNIGLSSYNTTVSPFVVDRYSIPVSDISRFYNFVGLFLFLNQLFLVPMMSRYLSPLSLLTSGILLISTGFLILPHISIFSLFIVAYYPLNLGIALCFSSFRPILISFCANEIKGRVLGVESMMQASGTSIGPILGSMIYQSAGYTSFALYALIFPFVLLLTLQATSLSRTRIISEPEPPE